MRIVGAIALIMAGSCTLLFESAGEEQPEPELEQDFEDEIAPWGEVFVGGHCGIEPNPVGSDGGQVLCCTAQGTSVAAITLPLPAARSRSVEFRFLAPLLPSGTDNDFSPFVAFDDDLEFGASLLANLNLYTSGSLSVVSVAGIGGEAADPTDPIVTGEWIRINFSLDIAKECEVAATVASSEGNEDSRGTLVNSLPEIRGVALGIFRQSSTVGETTFCFDDVSVRPAPECDP